jgi:hypothetical protein
MLVERALSRVTLARGQLAALRLVLPLDDGGEA